MIKCIYCEQEFVIKPTGKSGGTNRQLCYNCLPEGSNVDKKNIAVQYLTLRTQAEKESRGCDICGYNKCGQALEWHHFNDDKEENPSIFLHKGNREGLDSYYKETEKCQLLCANCHREIHAKLKQNFVVPEGTNEFEEFRELVKQTYLKTFSVTQTAKILNRDPQSIKRILEYLNIKIINKNAGAKVAMLNKSTDEILKVFDSISDAAKELGKDPKGSHIGDVCNGKRKTACGYKWRFV